MDMQHIINLLNNGYKIYEVIEDWMSPIGRRTDNRLYVAKDGLTAKELYDKYDNFMFEMDAIQKTYHESINDKDNIRQQIYDKYNYGSDAEDFYVIVPEISIITKVDRKESNHRLSDASDKSFLNPNFGSD